jgi:hypothetical protein
MEFHPVHIAIPSPRVLGKMKKGHKVRISSAEKGKGVDLLVCPDKFNHITRCFNKGKGLTIQLHPHEIHHNHAEGIFDTIGKAFKSAGNAINNKVIKPAGKVIVPIAKEAGKVLLPLGKELANKAIDYGAQYAPELAGTALAGLATATGNPELAPIAYEAGSMLGKAGAKAGSKYAKKQVADFDPYHQQTSSAPAPPSRSVPVDMLNAYNGTNMGYMDKASMGTAIANLSLGQLEDLLSQKRANMGVIAQPLFDMGGSRSLAPYTDAVPMSGQGLGLYAQPHARGLRQHRHRKEMSSVGIHGNLLSGKGMPPALITQPYSANFQFGHTLPPAYQKFAHSGMGLF